MADRYESRSDGELLRRARRDPDAFIAVCRRHGEALQLWLRRELGDDLLAQEVLAETFAAAWLASGHSRGLRRGAAGEVLGAGFLGGLELRGAGVDVGADVEA